MSELPDDPYDIEYPSEPIDMTGEAVSEDRSWKFPPDATEKDE